jgi:flagellar assembly factor FliW
MPTLACPDLGRFDYRDEEVLDFPEGLPAFETLKRFLLAQKDEFAPFVFLVSVDSPAVRFICVPVGRLAPDYRFELAAGEGVAMGLEDGIYSAVSGDPLLLAIVTLPHAAPATANLASPVVIDLKRRSGVQVILAGSLYSHVTPLRPLAAEEASC